MTGSERATAEDFAAARARLGESVELGRVVRRRRSSPRPHRRGVPLLAARGSRQPLEVQARVRCALAHGGSVNAIALSVGISHDAVETIRDGHSKAVKV